MHQRITKILLFLFIIPLSFLLSFTLVFALKTTDVDGNGVVNAQDVSLILRNWLTQTASVFDIDENLKVNSLDLGYVVKDYGKTLPTSTPYPTSPPPADGSEWTQHAHNAQRTGYTSEVPAQPWTFLWGWNGPDSQGKASKNFYTGPIRDAYSITGGTHVFTPAGAEGLFALAKAVNGKMFRGRGDEDWNFKSYQGTSLSFNSTPAYESGYVYAAASNGQVFKIQDNGTSYSVAGVYSAGSEINKPILSAGDSVYVVTKSGQLHRIRKSNMSQVWIYNAGSEAVIPPSYSVSRDILVFATRDLNVHAVRNSNGTQAWKTKPTSHTTSEHCGFYQYDYRWPVVADQQGIVFIRLRNSWDSVAYGSTNAAIKSALTANSGKQSLFALNLDNGSPTFIPAVAPVGADHRPNCTGNSEDDLFHSIADMPLVKILPDGKEVAYSIWRNSNVPYDPRWDAFMGEMNLDDNPATPNYDERGDMRSVNFTSQIDTNMISDEIHTTSMAGNTLFHHHICSVDIFTITSRTSDPITTIQNPVINRSWDNPSSPNANTHSTADSMDGCGDRGYGSGLWIYQGAITPGMLSNPEISGLGAEEGSVTRYAYVSDGMIIVHGGPRGDLFVLKHN